MPLPAGTRIGPYEIVAKLGAGGMGEVYRAHDAKLNRDVAIKVLPDLFATDPERLARLTREAQTLAALNHANIAHIYGVEGHALVMELVEGEDLAEHIARGPIPLAEALPMARQIANALEAAHDQGIIHRDLKPANIKVKPDGTVKVLDFGLAKALTEDSGLRTQDVSNSPTLTARATQMGMIIGTAAYMSPEQARGKSADRRADIWAFGLVLYEMLTGRRAFEGQEISDVLAAVLRQDIDWTPLPAGTPSSVRRLLRRCLEKDPRKRLSAIGDARLELDEPEPVTPVPASPAPPARPSIGARLWPAIAGVVLTAAVAALLWPRPTAVAPDGLSRLAILPPPGAELYPDSTGVAISPDGTMVAFVVGSVNQSISQLWVRSLDSSIARKLDDTEGALLPFWSPDSRRHRVLHEPEVEDDRRHRRPLRDACRCAERARRDVERIERDPLRTRGERSDLPHSGDGRHARAGDDPRLGQEGVRPPLSAVPARRRPLSLRVAAGQGGEVRHLRGLAQGQVAHARRRARKLAGLRRSRLAALRSAGRAGRAGRST